VVRVGIGGGYCFIVERRRVGKSEAFEVDIVEEEDGRQWRWRKMGLLVCFKRLSTELKVSR